MSAEDPALRSYRRFLVAFALVAGLIATTVGAGLLWKGHGFGAFLCVCVVAWLALITYGYRQDAAERQEAADRADRASAPQPAPDGEDSAASRPDEP